MDDISRSTDYPSRAATPGMQAVFVYGTLMRGHRNHGWLAGARFLGRGCLGGAVLYDLGPFPMAVEMDGCFPVASPSASASPSSPTPSTENGVIHGEVYAVNEAQLGDLDRLEGVPRLYRRQRLVLLDGREVWVYLGRARQVRHVAPIPDGRWRGPRQSRGTRRSPVTPLALSGWLALGLGFMPSQVHADSRHDCQLWRGSSGSQRAIVGNRLGAEHLLTKDHKLAETSTDQPVALYRRSDLERLCRGY